MKKLISSLVIMSVLTCINTNIFAQTTYYEPYGYVLDLTGLLPLEKSFTTETGVKITVKVKKYSQKKYYLYIKSSSHNKISYVEIYADGESSPITESSIGTSCVRKYRPLYLCLEVWIVKSKISGIRIVEIGEVPYGAKKIKNGLYYIPK